MACVLAWGMGLAPVRAQQADSVEADGSSTLEDIDVIGVSTAAGWNGASDAVYETPGAVAEIGRAAIEERGGARNVTDLFRGVAGVDGVVDRQNPGLNVNIRGLQDQGRVNMTIDGARQNFQQSGHGASSLAYIDPAFISRVDIDKGPTSTAGGAGVIGGVVNFRTLDFEDVALPDKQWGVRANGTTGTNAYDFNGSLVAAAKVSEAFEVVAGFGRKKLGEYDAGTRGKLVYSGLGEAARFTTQDQWSWLVKATARPSDEHKVTLSYTGLAVDFGTGSGQNIDLDKVQNHTVVADWRWTPGGPWADLSTKAYYTRTANDQFRPARLDPLDPDKVTLSAARVDYAIDTVGGSISNTSRFSIPLFDVALTYGGEVFHDKTATASVFADRTDDPSNSQFSGSNPNGGRTVGGAFTRAELKRGEWLSVLLGLRYDRFQMDGSGVVFDGRTTGCGEARCPTPFNVDVSGGRASPTATVAITPVKGLQFYGSYEQGYRPPNIMESILGGEHIGSGLSFAPNPRLKPEVSRTLEAGVNLKLDGVWREGDALRAKASVYRTGVDDFITLGLTSPRPGMLANQSVNLKDRTWLKGVDLEANYDAGVAYIGGTAAFIDARYKANYDAGLLTTPTILGIYLSPKRKLALDGGLRFFDRKLTLGGRVTQVTPEDGFSTTGIGYQYSKYTLHDVYASYKVNENFTIRGAIENIRDVAYVEALGAPLSPSPGRTLTIGATARF